MNIVKFKNNHGITLKGTIHMPLDFELVWISNKSNILIYPVPGIHISTTKQLTKIETHYIAKLFSKTHDFRFSPVKEMYYAHEYDQQQPGMSLLQESLPCVITESLGYQIQFHSKNSSHSEYHLQWFGSVNLNCSSFVSDDAEIPKEPIVSTSLEMSPKHGFHSKFHIYVSSFVDRMILLPITRDFFVDPFEIQRIDFGPIHVQVHGNVDLEVPSNSKQAYGHFVTISHIHETRKY
jgi:hypothetical protein